MAVSKTVMIIVIIAVIAIIAVAAFVLLNGNGNGGGNGGDDTDDYLTDKSGTAVVSSIDTKLLVFGNANNDVYLNNDDVTFIQNIVDGKTKWNKTANPLADTNADGSIDSKDVNLLKQFIAGKTAPMFYLNSYLDTVKIEFPLTGNVCVSQTLDADMLKIIGKYNLITACTMDSVDESKYPGSSKWVDVGNYPYDYESVVAANVQITLGQPYDYDETFENLVKNGYGNYRLDMVKLHEARYIHGVDSIACTVTLGALMNCFSNTTYKEYLDYVANINDILDKATSGVTSKLTYSLVLSHATSSPAEMAIDNQSTAEENYSDVAMAENLKLTNSYPLTNESYIRGLSIEEILKYKPDVVFIEESNGSQTRADFESTVNTIAQYFKSAGYTGTIIGIHWSVSGSTASTAALPLLATYIYGTSSYSEDSAWNDLVYYYNTFLGENYTVNELKNSIYGPFKVQ